MTEAEKRKIRAAHELFVKNYDTYEAAPEYIPWVADEYLCTFDNTQSELHAARTGRVGFKFVFEVVGGDYSGRNLYLDRWLESDPGDGNKLEKHTKRALETLELSPADLGNPPAVAGQFSVTLAIKNGKPDVVGFKKA